MTVLSKIYINLCDICNPPFKATTLIYCVTSVNLVCDVPNKHAAALEDLSGTFRKACSDAAASRRCFCCVGVIEELQH